MTSAIVTKRMEEATRLTRAGKLHEAMAILQGAMPVGKKGPRGQETPDESCAEGETFEGAWEVMDEGIAVSRPASAGPAPDRSREPPAGAAPGSFTAGCFTNVAGTRDYKLYIPSGYQGRPLPLVVMLHGCTQDPDDFAAGTGMNRLAEERLCCVLYPAQPMTANSSKCWNWFKAEDQQREGGEPAIISGMTRQIIQTHGLDASRVYAAGLSAGAAMATTLAMTHPDLFAAVGIHSGLPHGVAQSLPNALGAMQGGTGPRGGGGAGRESAWASEVPAIVFHGDRDMTVHPGNADRVAAQYAASRAGETAGQRKGSARVTVERGQVADGHAYTRTTHHGVRGEPRLEQWRIQGGGHAWSGGDAKGSYTDPRGPDAAKAMLRFFYRHRQGE